jgi:hypothetical protein
MLYLAMMFIVLVTASFGIEGAVVGALLALVTITRNESRASS